MSHEFFLCYFETTRRCNLACPYCMSRTGVEGRGKELDTDEAKHLVLDEIAKFRSNAAVAFSGGEHLMRDDALELLRYAAEIGLFPFLNTNATMLDREMLERIRDATGGRIVFVLPLNSIDASANEWSRNDASSTVLRAVHLCEKLGLDYFFITTISHQNLPTLAATMEHLKHLQMPVLRAPFVPRGAGGGFPQLLFTKEDMKATIYPALRDNYLSYISYTPFFASPEFLEEKGKSLGVRIAGLGCHAARSFAAVSAEGNVAPCVQLLDSGVERGNVRDRPLAEILDFDPVFQAMRHRDQLKGKCGRCRYRWTCGGCRALAYYHNGDYLAEDPTCFFEPVDETTKSEFEDIQNRNVSRFIDYIKFNEPWNLIF